MKAELAAPCFCSIVVSCREVGMCGDVVEFRFNN